jgi:hypothetical protein
MPGLIRGVARTAVVAGTATAVSNRVSRRQAGRWAQQSQPQYEQRYEAQPPPGPPQYSAPPPPPPEDPMDVRIEQLSKLGELKSQGILTEEEFQAQKAKLLAG